MRAHGEAPREGQAAGSEGAGEEGDAAEVPDAAAAQGHGQKWGKKQKKKKQRRGQARTREEERNRGEEDDDLAFREAEEHNEEEYQQAFQKLAAALSLFPTEGMDEASQRWRRTVMEMAREEAQGPRPGEDMPARAERWASVVAERVVAQQSSP